MVGMSIPFAIKGRLKRGNSKFEILLHILIRTTSLLLIGVLMLNVGRINPTLTGISKYLWAILVYVSVFLIWNMYNFKPSLKIVEYLLKLTGFISLVYLLVIYRSGTAENPGWLITSWWGILGLIGWGYLAAAITYLFFSSKLLKTTVVLLVFMILNILSLKGLTGIFDPIKPVFGILIQGNTPSIVITGLLISLIFSKLQLGNYKKLIVVIVSLGLISILLGFVLRNWFIISKTMATPSWSMICNGISMILFAVIFLIADVWKKTKWASIFKPAGQNSLTTYLAPDILYYMIWGLSLPILFYKQDENQLLAVAGSLAWAVCMVLFAALLSKMKIRLKL
jgi:hypothetical protein